MSDAMIEVDATKKNKRKSLGGQKYLSSIPKTVTFNYFQIKANQ